MKKILVLSAIAALLVPALFLAVSSLRAEDGGEEESKCVTCHREKTPAVVKDWESSRHAKAESRRASCHTCHGSGHDKAENKNLAKMPTAKTCRKCHLKTFKQYEKGKHALAWEAITALPMTHRLPKEEIQGFKGCGGCHKVGLIEAKDHAPTRFTGGSGCAACHGKHRFSLEQARDPRMCASCHTGIDHPQWEMWSTSKHGIAYLAQGSKDRAPSCRTCHFPEGDHENITAWGFLAVRVADEDEAWNADRAEILKAFGVIDAGGKPTALFPLVEKLKLARTSRESFDALREKKIVTCRKCHGESFVRERFQNYDQTVRESDRHFAESIRIVAGLYKDGLIEPGKGAPVKGYPFVLDFYDVNTAIEEKLYLMFEEYRMRAVQGAFHGNWDYHHWRGYAKMIKTLVEMREKAAEMRAKGK